MCNYPATRNKMTFLPHVWFHRNFSFWSSPLGFHRLSLNPALVSGWHTSPQPPPPTSTSLSHEKSSPLLPVCNVFSMNKKNSLLDCKVHPAMVLSRSRCCNCAPHPTDAEGTLCARCSGKARITTFHWWSRKPAIYVKLTPLTSTFMCAPAHISTTPPPETITLPTRPLPPTPHPHPHPKRWHATIGSPRPGLTV